MGVPLSQLETVKNHFLTRHCESLISLRAKSFDIDKILFHINSPVKIRFFGRNFGNSLIYLTNFRGRLLSVLDDFFTGHYLVWGFIRWWKIFPLKLVKGVAEFWTGVSHSFSLICVSFLELDYGLYHLIRKKVFRRLLAYNLWDYQVSLATCLVFRRLSLLPKHSLMSCLELIKLVWCHVVFQQR